MSARNKMYYGNTGLLAEKTYRNFENCLMLMLSVMLAGLVLPITAELASLDYGFMLSVLIALSIGIWVFTFQIFSELVEY